MSGVGATNAKTEHPAWRVYWDARIAMDKARDEVTRQHRIMEDAGDELESAGEMQRDPR